jgi:hypothetical protein
MKIEVTQKDIKNGTDRKESFYFCPIALAVKRKMNTICDANTDCSVIVYGDCIEILVDYSYRIYKLTAKAKEFIQRFDEGKKVKPFTFEARKIKNEN